MMLRPSQLQSNSANSAESDKTFKLKPSTLSVSPCSTSNIFKTELDPSSTNTDSEAADSISLTNSVNPFINPFGRDEESPKQNKEVGKTETKVDENQDPLSKLCSKNNAVLPKSNLFSAKATTISSDSGFVFGQNISERVTGANNIDNNKEDVEKVTNHVKDGENSSNSGLLFSSGITGNSTVEVIEQKEVDGQSLLEATRKYEEKFKVQKRKYEEVETKTGEEDERNVFEVNCKIFAFVASNYEERGRGILRLNDSKVKAHESRVVFRTSGNFRVLINTKIWAGMVATKASNKSLRITAIDVEGHIKVFLIMSRPEDIEKLHKHLNERIKSLKDIQDANETKSENLSLNEDSTLMNISKTSDSSECETKQAIIEANGQDKTTATDST